MRDITPAFEVVPESDLDAAYAEAEAAYGEVLALTPERAAGREQLVEREAAAGEQELARGDECVEPLAVAKILAKLVAEEQPQAQAPRGVRPMLMQLERLLTQLTLGLDRDSGLELLAADFDERDPAVKSLISLAIAACKRQGKYIGICGQGPSDHPDFAQWLEQQGISSISLNPDSVVATWQQLANQ